MSLTNLLGASEARETTPAAAALEKLRGLAGEWSGTLSWSGDRSGSGTLIATYAVAARGSAVVETLIMDGEPSMTSVYHLDGADLRMTHYCGAQNQPRLKSERIDLSAGAIDFAFVDITNLASPQAGHVAGAQLRFPDPDRVTLVFLFVAGEKRSTERIELKRVGPKAS